jgi:polyisoprenoid-binding protein YceI
MSVELVYDAETPARSQVEVRVPTRALRIDSREAIAAGRLPSHPDPETVEKLQTKMLSPRVLDAERYPTIDFSSTGVEGSDGRLRVRGTFRMHGRAREIEIPVRVARLESGAFRFSGEFQLRQTEFGIQPESIAGVVKVADPVTIRFDVVARPSDARGAR